MGRDALYGMLLGMLSAKGRDEALLGDDLLAVREAYARMAPEGGQVHAYFEVPLWGDPGLDTHCIVAKTNLHLEPPQGADATWAQVLTWFLAASRATDVSGGVAVMAEADTSTNPRAQPGLGLIEQNATQLVEPFLELIGEASKMGGWRFFVQNLPKEWKTSYVGVFPQRPGNLLRVNAHPRSSTAADLDEALSRFGYALDAKTLALLAELVQCGRSYDIQLDLDEEGRARGVVGCEVYVEGSRNGRLLCDVGGSAKAMALLERHGLADKRWELLKNVSLSRRVQVPQDGQLVDCALSLRPYSVKVKVADGSLTNAKAYLRGDAAVLDASGNIA